jgi:flagellar hook-associated protein 3 FlgL
MRITLIASNDQNLLTLENQETEINQISQTISSGQKMSSPSDDPYSWAQAMNVQQGVREYNSVLGNVSYANGFEQATSSALSQLSDLLSQAKDVAISAASSTSSSSSYTSEVSSILQQALNLANTQYDGEYIFAGTATDTAPYSIDSNGNVTGGGTGSIEVRTGVSNGTDSNLTQINVPGDDVFTFTSGGSTKNVLSQLYQLQQALNNGDSSAISGAITTMGDAFENVNNQITINGDRMSALSTQQSALTTLQTDTKNELSGLQDTDLAAATTKLDQMQTSFEAALKVTSMLDNLNLAAYLAGDVSSV